MEKFPFTPTGLNDLLSNIYSQSDQQVSIQADAVKTDFRAWITNNFFLEPTQLGFLDQLDARFVAISANETSSFISQRKMIQLIKLERTTRIASDASDEGKLLDLSKKSEASYAADGTFAEAEQLAFTISYS